MRAIVDYGIYGEYDDNDPLVNANMRAIVKNIDKAKDRYNKAVENGKKGGRPSTIDKDKIIYLHNQGLTNKEVAAELKCSISTVEKTLKKYRDDNFLPNDRKNRKNLDVDEDVDDDDDKYDDADVDTYEEHFKTGGITDKTVITYNEFLRLGEKIELRLINNNKEAICDETGEILTVIGAPLPFNQIAK